MDKEVSDIKYDWRRFGWGDLLGNDYRFLDKDRRQQALELGWSHGCPIAEEISDPESQQFGPEYARSRYAECNFWFGWILSQAKKENEALYEQLIRPVVRLSGETVGKHEPESVPESHRCQMAPMSTPWGYALPRVLKILDKVISRSSTPIELLIRLSEKVILADANPVAVLSHVLSIGVLKEENCPSIFQQIAGEMKKEAPKLWEFYSALTIKERKKNGIVDISILT